MSDDNSKGYNKKCLKRSFNIGFIKAFSSLPTQIIILK